MDSKEFREEAHKMVDWMADYLEGIEEYPVKPDIDPGEIYKQLPASPPNLPESMQTIFTDFKDIIVPGMTHWQHPGFHAYFPGNSSKPSVLAEMLTATLGSQCMVWATSPAATELEEKVMEWLKQMLSLPEQWTGSIQSGASDAAINAVLSARERHSSNRINEAGFTHNKFRIYCSQQAHSSIDKAVALSGIGRDNLIKIAVDDDYAMDPALLQDQIIKDKQDGYHPLLVLAAMGTTGSTAIDPLQEIATITSKENIWLHVDAALAGTALILEEMRWMAEGLEMADSFVFNPHKWMFTNFDCSAYFVRDKQALLNTFSINPEYLKTKEDAHVNNYRDWGIPLGRRFRALKLWFVIRNFGVEVLQEKIRLHLALSKWFEEQIITTKSFELLAPVPLNTICFRFAPKEVSEADINTLNEQLLDLVNKTGKIFITHVKLKGKYCLRMVIGQTEVQKHHIESAWILIHSTALSLIKI